MGSLTFRDIYTTLRKLELDKARPVIAHASLSAFGKVSGGAETIVGALVSSYDAVVMPAFTYKTMVIPETGPLGNALDYGSGIYSNRLAQFFHSDMPTDRLIGSIPEALRRYPKAERSSHPILSFTGFNARSFLEAQSISEPLAPIRCLHEAGGWVLLLGVGHTVNTSLHYAERLAGRKQFLRWALTPQGIVACPGFPGCSDGFEAVKNDLEPFTRRIIVGNALVQAVPLTELVKAVTLRLAVDAHALLCSRPDCARCNAVRGNNPKI